MSEIKKLIERLCPEGVEYKPLWQLTAWDKKFNGVEKSMQKKIIKYPYVLAKVFDELEVEKGDVKLLSTGISDKERWTTEAIAGDLVCEGEIVAIPWGGTPNVKYYKGKFVTADNRIATSLDTSVLNNKFLFYYLNNIIEDIAALYRGAGIQHPSMKGVLSLEIPVPPIEVQSKIVEILDNFTELEAKLEAELEARRKQYEYYRNQLLTFDEDSNVKYMKLGDLAELVTKQTGFDYTKTIRPSLLRIQEEDSIPYMQTKNFSGRVFDYNTDYYVPRKIVEQFPRIVLNKKCLLFSIVGASIGNVGLFPGTKECFLGGAICVIKFKDGVNIAYIYEIMSSWYGQQIIRKKTKGLGQATVTVEDIRNFVIPIPSPSEQERIVSILDRFEALTTDLQSGLPAEIEARRKQYEYYREQLLTFKRKTA